MDLESKIKALEERIKYLEERDLAKSFAIMALKMTFTSKKLANIYEIEDLQSEIRQMHYSLEELEHRRQSAENKSKRKRGKVQKNDWID